jgi:hypothetical protein
MSKDPRTVEQPQAQKKRRGPMRLLRSFGLGRSDDVPAPTREDARQRIRSRPGFYASLSPEARASIENYDGPEVLGPARGDG